MSLKWYFAISEPSLDREHHDFRNLIRVAVESARQNTQLRPNMLYNGEPNDFTREMARKGVNVIPHRVSFYPELQQQSRTLSWADLYLSTATGAFLRTEIPLIETEDDFVLYTDCDVMLMKDIPAFTCPEPFAVVVEGAPDAFDINTGVMLINVRRSRDNFSEFRKFIRANLHQFTIYDQSAYSLFYAQQNGTLKPELNWRPYWGFNENAVVVHWHGPKPIAVRYLLDDPSADLSDENYWRPFFQREPDSYRRYFAIWAAFFTNLLRSDRGGGVDGGDQNRS
jgi:hypothetical protein